VKSSHTELVFCWGERGGGVKQGTGIESYGSVGSFTSVSYPPKPDDSDPGFLLNSDPDPGSRPKFLNKD
jgi:hypothetical protein